MSLLCLVGWHDDHRTHDAGVLRLRCQRCGRLTPGWDLRDVPKPTPTYAGHLTAREVRRIRRRGKHARLPAYVSPQVTAELAAYDAAVKAKQRRGPALVTAIRRSA